MIWIGPAIITFIGFVWLAIERFKYARKLKDKNKRIYTTWFKGEQKTNKI